MIAQPVPERFQDQSAAVTRDEGAGRTGAGAPFRRTTELVLA
jgi:hypothetical protein